MADINYKDEFYRIFDEIKVSHPVWKEMMATKEDTPWHREDSVAIHTEMVLHEFRQLIGPRQWTKDDMIGAFACAFHDFGKPSARVVKFKPERGNYNSFAGHELTSARFWEDYAASHWKQFVDLGFGTPMIYTVGVLIEHHLPYDTKDPGKRKNLARTVMNFTRDSTLFGRVLIADAWGRISDDAPDKRARVLKWIEEFEPLYQDCAPPPIIAPDRTKSVFLLVGPSGCGKSSVLTKMVDEGDVMFSWDALRLRYYGDPNELDPVANYRKAFIAQEADKDFINNANSEFVRDIKLFAGKQNIYVDNTNLSAKRRRFFIDQARRNGYRAVAIVLPISMQMLKERCASRTDKSLPESVVISQYMKLQLPLLGEVDDIIFSVGNL